MERIILKYITYTFIKINHDLHGIFLPKHEYNNIIFDHINPQLSECIDIYLDNTKKIYQYFQPTIYDYIYFLNLLYIIQL